MSKHMPNERLNALQVHIAQQYADLIDGAEFAKDELVVLVKRDSIVKMLEALKNDAKCEFSQLVDITAVDYPERALRFEVVYNLLSLSHNMRIRLKIMVEDQMAVQSASGLYASAGWLEREVWDMYGIVFEGHADLRRILTDYGFEGHPLRKDFPLSGYVELRYDEAEARVVYEPVSFQQEFREFENLSPWEGMTNVQLPGDEKAVKQAYGTIDYRTRARERAKEEASDIKGLLS